MKLSWKLVAMLLLLVSPMLFAAGQAEDGDESTAPSGKVWSEGNLTNATLNTDEWIEASIAADTYTYAMPNDAEYLLIMEEKYKIDFDVWPAFGDEWKQILNLRFAAGETLDILNPKQFSLFELLDQDLIRDVPEEMLREFMPRSWEDWHSNVDNPFQLTRVDGTNYAIPGFYPPGDYPYVVLIRDDWMENLGLSDLDPSNLDELETILYAFAESDPDGNGKADTYGLSDRGMMAIYGAFGGIPYSSGDNPSGNYIISDDGQRVIHVATQPAMKEALALLSKWYADGVLDPEWVTGERTGGHWAESQAWARGRIGYTHGAMYYYHGTPEERKTDHEGPARLQDVFEKTQANLGFPDATYEYVDPPVGPYGDSGTEKWGANTGPWWVFGRHLVDDEYKMARLMHWQERIGQYLDDAFSVTSGIKGVDWYYDDELGRLVQYQSEKTREAQEAGTRVLLGLTNAFDALSFKVAKATDKPGYDWADQIADHEGYHTVNGSIPALVDYGAELGALTATFYTDVITGNRSVEDFDEYVAQWESIGGEIVLESANEWWDSVK